MEKQDYVDSKIKYKKPEVDNKDKKEKRKCMNFDICKNEFLSEIWQERLDFRDFYEKEILQKLNSYQ